MTTIATRDQNATSLIPQYDREFAAVLPDHIKSETFVQLAVAALRKNPKLMEAANASPASLIYALRECARLGHEPGSDSFYLTPRKEKGSPVILGIEGYRGVVERMYRAGAVSTVIVEVVRENDEFRYIKGVDDRPEHIIDWKLDDDGRGPIYLAYAYARMKDGAYSRVVTVNRSRVARAKAESYGSDSPSSPWVKHVESMWAKTAAHDLEPWVPTSAEYRREQLRAVRAVASEFDNTAGPVNPIVADTVTGEVLDGQAEWPDAAVPGGAA